MFCLDVVVSRTEHMHRIEIPSINSPMPWTLSPLLGLTNSWSGNVFYRDVIALHRPDYIRAIKMDKPAVARKIVRSIRMGKPPGR